MTWIQAWLTILQQHKPEISNMLPQNKQIYDHRGCQKDFRKFGVSGRQNLQLADHITPILFLVHS